MVLLKTIILKRYLSTCCQRKNICYYLLLIFIFPYQVDWDEEEDCFKSFAKETGLFYSIHKNIRLKERDEKQEQVCMK